ncbi:hypothetical protein EXT47_21240 [Pseudoalteromonas sp. CO342X]|uniref:Uncharacterized protein n=1 Tax=Pseudoalteromonas maricaloris TaxID=184924 RepID=A0A8I2HCX0_9GAMM|nr:hypothetical protein TW73_15690 [Pseudoalteromonas piscicida]NLR24376.1 hypothetical protein [Pseudoalteromonas maricaloris]RZG12826.1 hypothetical protein EXT47_21240 [Pseudoalteromonas sp. CO342X]
MNRLPQNYLHCEVVQQFFELVNYSAANKKVDKTQQQLMNEQVEKAFKEYGPDAKLNIRLERCPLNKK